MARGRLWLVLAVTSGCNAGPGEPRPFVVNVAPTQVFAGDSVFVRSAQFRAVPDSQINVRLPDSAQFDLPVRRVDDTTVVFDVPPLLTGSYAFTVHHAGTTAPVTEFGLAVSGVAWLEWHGRVRGTDNMQVLDGSRVIYQGQPVGSAYTSPWRFMVLDPVARTEWFATTDTASSRMMYGPGTSFRGGHVVLDFSGPGSGAADGAVWAPDFTQQRFTRVRTLPCGEPLAGSYTAAELSDSICVWMTYPDSLIRNAATSVLTDRGFGGAHFRTMPGGSPTVILNGDWRVWPFDGSWPVLDANGRVAWTWSRYGRVAGAARADTLYVVGQGKGTDSTWTLDLFDATSGTQLAADSFPALRLLDVMTDPGRNRLYVAGVTQEAFASERRHVIIVMERSTRRQLAAIRSPFDTGGIYASARLVPGPAAGRVHLLLINVTDPIINLAVDVP